MKRALIAALLLAASGTTGAAQERASTLATLPKLSTVDERYQGYNVEMVEVTGGRFWAPYGGAKGEIYAMRPPVNLADKRLRNLARHLAPAYMRVSGTWANSSYLPAEGEQITAAPTGFKQILTRDQWRGVIAFAKAANARLVTSFAASDGTRGPDGVWKAEQAQRLVDLTRESGGTIYAAEFFNEPNVPTHGGLPKGYGVTEYNRDFRIFHAWARIHAPTMKILGHGGVSEGSMMKLSAQTIARGFLNSEDFMKGNPGNLDAVTYHFYGSISERCGGSPIGARDKALSAEWLDRTLLDQAHYAALRDTYEPGKPLWLNETAQAGCGGSRWAATFLDSFRYLNQLGLLAQKGVQAVMHNTLAASEYGLIDFKTMAPRPNYWAAVLWAKTMGATVLASPLSPPRDVRLYAHCLKGARGGVGLLAINTGSTAQTITTSKAAAAWVMSGPLDGGGFVINGRAPSITADGRLVGLEGRAAPNKLLLPAQSIAFIAAKDARNTYCQ